MSTSIGPYLNFDGKAREAMTFYKECFGGETTFLKVEGTPMEAQCPPSMKDQILHSCLVTEDFTLMGSDMHEGAFIQGNNFAVNVNCDSRADLDKYFDFLSAGGRVQCPIMEQFWGGTFGAVVDKFGIGWLFNYEKPKA